MTPRIILSIHDICAARWNTLTGTSYPFLTHEFLQALESSQSVGFGTGWQQQYLIIEEAEQLIAVLPLWLKTHSFGEYVFDHEWARAYARHGLVYYPKLIAAIPFTPASGSRLVIDANINPDTVFPLISHALQQLLGQTGASGWHILFPDSAELAYWHKTNASYRLGCQFHWFNRSYVQFDDFLASLTSKRRKEIRRERRRVQEQGIHLQRLTGDELTSEHWTQFYGFYKDTYQRRSGHDGYLTEAFFHAIHKTMRHKVLLVLAYNNNNVAIGGALSFFSDDTLYGRYWGAIQDVEFLHFEACLYQGIEFCIERGLQRFDPGAQGEHKIPRGFEPVLTHSFHYLAHQGFNEAVADFVLREGEAIRQYAEQARQLLPFKT